MDNPTEGNYYQLYNPEDPMPSPPPRYYDGNEGFATVSLVMGILALVSLCCFPFISIPFTGLGILFSCLSKGKHSRPGTAKAGMGISAALLAVLAAIVAAISVWVLSSPTGQSIIRDYMNLITSDTLTEQDIYEFIQKYTDEFSQFDSGSSSSGIPDYNSGEDAYEDFFNDYFDYFNGGEGYPGYSDPDDGGFSGGYEETDPGTGDNYI